MHLCIPVVFNKSLLLLLLANPASNHGKNVHKIHNYLVSIYNNNNNNNNNILLKTTGIHKCIKGP